MNAPMNAPIHVSYPPPLPSRSASPLRFIVDRNPFYILSALCMFAGFRLILSSLDPDVGDLRTMFLLIGVLGVYQAMLVALALFLVVRRGLRRDGWMLLSISALFMADLTFFNGQVAATSLFWGGIVNAIALAVALMAISIVVRVLRLRVTGPQWIFLAALWVLLLAMGSIFRAASHGGTLSPLVLYGAWWVMGLLAVAAAVVLRHSSAAADHSPMQNVVAGLYMILPAVSLLVHLCGAYRVYDMDPDLAVFAPPLLGLVVLLAECRRRWGRFPFLGIEMGLTVLAVIFSAGTTPWLNITVGHAVVLSPLRLALVGAAGVWGYSFWLDQALIEFWLAIACLGAACFGASGHQIGARLTTPWRWATTLADKLTPETPRQWGAAAVTAAFFLLAVGAGVSLRRRRPEKDAHDMA